MAYANIEDQGLHCHSAKYFKKELHKKQNLGQTSMEKF